MTSKPLKCNAEKAEQEEDGAKIPNCNRANGMAREPEGERRCSYPG